MSRKEYQRFTYSEEDLRKSLQEIRNGMSLNRASKLFLIPKSTLHNKINNKVPIERKMGPQTILTKDEEIEIKNWIIRKAELGFPLHPEDVKDTIQKILNDLPRQNMFKNNRPGEKWFKLFLKRHPDIVIRNTDVISKARAAVTKENICEWFKEVRLYIKNKNAEDLLLDGSRIFNCDETGFLTCPKSGKLLGPKNLRNFYEISNGLEKECITVLCTFNAYGAKLPPMVLYSYKRIPSSIIATFPEEWAYGRSDSGWMVSASFYEYVANIFYPWLEINKIQLPVILFLDGHKSHLSLELSKFCDQNKIILYCLPPNATHIVQPCDVAIFRPMKVAWKKVTRREKQKGVAINKHNFTNLFKEAFEAVTTDSIINGFRACGIFPFTESAIDFRKCMPTRANDLNNNHNVSTITLDDLKTTRRVIEHFIDQNKLKTFKKCVKTKSKVKAEEDSSLFSLWKKCVNDLRDQDLDESHYPEDSDAELERCSSQNLLNLGEIVVTKDHYIETLPLNMDLDINSIPIDIIEDKDLEILEFADNSKKESGCSNQNNFNLPEDCTVSDSDDLNKSSTVPDGCHNLNFNLPEDWSISNIISDDLNKSSSVPDGCDNLNVNLPEDCSINNSDDKIKISTPPDGCDNLNFNLPDDSSMSKSICDDLNKFSTVPFACDNLNVNLPEDCSINNNDDRIKFSTVPDGCDNLNFNLPDDSSICNSICDDLNQFSTVPDGCDNLNVNLPEDCSINNSDDRIKFSTVPDGCDQLNVNLPEDSFISNCDDQNTFSATLDNHNSLNLSNENSASDIQGLWYKHLHYPEKRSNVGHKDKRNRQIKERIPYCISSGKWREIQEQKLREKEEKQLAIKRRKIERLNKKAEINKNKTNKKKKMNFNKKKENVTYKCPGCEEVYSDPPIEDWIMCNICEAWWHESCSSASLSNDFFVCDFCE